MDPLAVATGGIWLTPVIPDVKIAPPVVSNLTRSGASGSVDIAVEDENYITTVHGISDIGANDVLIGTIVGSGTCPLDFSEFTRTDVIPGVTVCIPVGRTVIQTTDGNGNFSEAVIALLCYGIVPDSLTVTEYSRPDFGETVTFVLTGLADGDTALAAYRGSDGDLAFLSCVNGQNTITGLMPFYPYSFLLLLNRADGTLGIPLSEFGDVPQSAPSGTSIEEQILANLETAIKAMQGSGWAFHPRQVERSKLPYLTKFSFYPAVDLGVINDSEDCEQVQEEIETTMRVIVGIYMDEHGPDTPQKLSDAIAQVKYAIMADHTRGGLAVETKVASSTREFRDETKTPSAIANMVIEILYYYKHGDPYSS